jgi:hypothetical protein
MEQRPFVFCLVPPQLSAELLEPLRTHFKDEPLIDVIVERRGGPKGESIDHRIKRELSAAGDAEQRAPVVPRARLIENLPAELKAHADDLQFVQRLTPVRPGLEDRGILEVVGMLQQGDPDAPSELYWRSFERVHRRLMLHLRTPAETDVAVKGAYGRIFDRLPGFDSASHSLPVWIDAVVDEYVSDLRREGGAE